MGKAIARPVGLVRLDGSAVFVGDKAQQADRSSIAGVANISGGDCVLGDANADLVAEHLLGEWRDLVEQGSSAGEDDASG